MKLKRSQSIRIFGFTLIEIMVSAALIAILFSFAFISFADFRWISNETNYYNALRLMKLNSRIVRAGAFDSFPPDTRVIPSEGIINLSKPRVVPDSVSIVLDGGHPVSPEDYRVDSDRGAVSWLTSPPAGKKAFIKYSYLVPDSLEVCRVPDKPPLTLQLINHPVSSIDKIEMIEGNRKTPVDNKSYKIDNNTGKITFEPGMAGRIIQVKYTGEKIKGICTSKYLDPGTLEETWNPTSLKLIKITEVYGDGGNYLETVQFRMKN